LFGLTALTGHNRPQGRKGVFMKYNENITRFIEDISEKTPMLGRSGFKSLDRYFYDIDFISIDECQKTALNYFSEQTYWNKLTPAERQNWRRKFNIINEKFENLYDSASEYAFLNR